MIQQIKEGYVQTKTHNGITTIEFFYPKGNSLPIKILEELAKEIHFAGTHDDNKVIILKSAGDATFCAGASFDELLAIKQRKKAPGFLAVLQTSSMPYACALNLLLAASRVNALAVRLAWWQR